MIDRLLPVRAAGAGVVIGVAVFLTLHFAQDRSAAITGALFVGGVLLTAALVWYVRHVELLRTRQAQGWFAATMIIAAITLIMLPPGVFA